MKRNLHKYVQLRNWKHHPACRGASSVKFTLRLDPMSLQAKFGEMFLPYLNYFNQEVTNKCILTSKFFHVQRNQYPPQINVQSI